MTINSVLRSPVHNFLATVVLVAAVVLIFAGENSLVEADEIPPFILKTYKSFPRLGRSGGSFEDFYLKASKSIPRIGRRGYSPASTKTGESGPWFPKRPVNLLGPGGDNQWSSENYVHAMEQSPELWEVISADTAADPPTAPGFNSQVWQREKRTGSEQAEV